MPRWNGGVIGAANNPTSSSAKGIWSLSEATKAIRAGLWPPSNAGADPYFENVTLLLPGDGTNGAQNNTFLDSSTNNFTITRNGNTTQGTFTPFSKPDGRWSNYFAGSQSISAAASTDFEFAGDFTIESWVYPTTTGADNFFIQNSGSNYFAVNVNAGTGFEVFLNSSTPTFSPTDIVPPLNQWSHIALVRSGSTVKLYLNGTASTTTATNSSTLGYNAIFYVGALGTSSSGPFVGHASNFRAVNGTAVYTANFTAPTAPLSAITNTKLLTCQSNRFIDNSSGAKAITVNGSPQITTFSPFPTLTAYAAGTNGGSGYFDGTGDYLSVSNNALIATGDFTMEAWCYTTRNNAYQGIISSGDSSNTAGARIVQGNTGNIEFWVNGQSNAATALPLNQWNHVAIVRSGSGSNNISFYLNGTRLAQVTQTSSTSNNTVVVGRYYNNGTDQYHWLGYIADARFVVGSAVYSGATYTLPTAPLTAVTNTAMLLNYTNGGIIDTSMSNDLETFGNAQISTTQSKFGGASMYFDGTGDYLDARLGPVQVLGGDFTVEMWVYPTTITGSNRTFLFLENGSNSAAFFMYGATGYVGLDINNVATYNLGSTAITTNSWQHLAFVRSGSTLTAYINGTSVGTATVTASLGSSGIMRIGAGASASAPYFGYFDEMRVTKGYARYTANFTAPTSPFNGFGD
jgi:hypothetical protein